ncbi:MAG TPA: hypothetical protein VGS13_04800 [Stellaceae bacterium]|nr:hypothetical protein [Stellaceae bacterium]
MSKLAGALPTEESKWMWKVKPPGVLPLTTTGEVEANPATGSFGAPLAPPGADRASDSAPDGAALIAPPPDTVLSTAPPASPAAVTISPDSALEPVGVVQPALRLAISSLLVAAPSAPPSAAVSAKTDPPNGTTEPAASPAPPDAGSACVVARAAAILFAPSLSALAARRGSPRVNPVPASARETPTTIGSTEVRWDRASPVPTGSSGAGTSAGRIGPGTYDLLLRFVGGL